MQFSLNKKYTKYPTLFGAFVIAISYVNKKASMGMATIIGNIINVITRILSTLFIILFKHPNLYIINKK